MAMGRTSRFFLPTRTTQICLSITCDDILLVSLTFDRTFTSHVVLEKILTLSTLEETANNTVSHES